MATMDIMIPSTVAIFRMRYKIAVEGRGLLLLLRPEIKPGNPMHEKYMIHIIDIAPPPIYSV